jgi:hypothetical protein
MPIGAAQVLHAGAVAIGYTPQRFATADAVGKFAQRRNFLG